jgi:anti-sigma regulatory factor (Ser/Thr protein kinase)
LTERAAHARKAVADLASEYSVEMRHDASLVISELVTNAVNHAQTAAYVEIWAEPDTLTISVADLGPGLVDHAAPLRPPDLPRRGAGLWLCHAVSHEFSINNTITGCQARARFHRSAP